MRKRKFKQEIRIRDQADINDSPIKKKNNDESEENKFEAFKAFQSEPKIDGPNTDELEQNEEVIKLRKEKDQEISVFDNELAVYQRSIDDYKLQLDAMNAQLAELEEQ